MSGNIQSTNIECRAGASETVMTMQSDTPSSETGKDHNPKTPRYDETQQTVFADGYSIKLAGGTGDESTVHEIFFYRDQNIDFYFAALRARRVLMPQNLFPPSRLVDNETYVVDRLWCLDIGCVELKKNIPENHKKIARANILQGMMVMEGNFKKRPTKVEFSR